MRENEAPIAALTALARCMARVWYVVQQELPGDQRLEWFDGVLNSAMLDCGIIEVAEVLPDEDEVVLRFRPHMKPVVEALLWPQEEPVDAAI